MKRNKIFLEIYQSHCIYISKKVLILWRNFCQQKEESILTSPKTPPEQTNRSYEPDRTVSQGCQSWESKLSRLWVHWVHHNITQVVLQDRKEGPNTHLTLEKVLALLQHKTKVKIELMTTKTFFLRCPFINLILSKPKAVSSYRKH